MTFFILYIVISVVVGCIDIRKEVQQERDFLTIPEGDIGYYIEPKKIYGIHNYLFLPSWGIVLIWHLIVRLINRVLY